MAIQAIALLQIADLQLPAGTSARVQRLDDAVLLHTGASFADEPGELSAQVRALIGDALADRHADARGIFFLPHVAAPSARSYQGVLDEVGEGGVWGPSRPQAPAFPAGFDAGNLAALLGQVPPSLIDAVSEVTRRDPNALQQASVQLQALLGQSGARGVSELLSSAGINLPQGGLDQLVAGVQQELNADPNRLANLAQELLGKAGARDEADDDADDEDASKPTR